MRTAICFSGYPRLNSYGIDLAEDLQSIFGSFDSFWYLPITPIMATLQYYFNAKSVEIQNDVQFNLDESFPSNHNLKTGLEAFLQQVNGWKQSYRLCQEYSKEQDIDYDILVRCRPDIKFSNTDDIKISADKLTVPRFHSYYGYNDRFAFGPKVVMEHYFNFIDFIIDTPNVVSKRNAEACLKICLDSKEIEVKEDSTILFHRIRNLDGVERIQRDFVSKQ